MSEKREKLKKLSAQIDKILTEKEISYFLLLADPADKSAGIVSRAHMRTDVLAEGIYHASQENPEILLYLVSLLAQKTPYITEDLLVKENLDKLWPEGKSEKDEQTGS